MNGTVAVMLDNPSGSAGLVRDGRLTGFAVTRPSAAVPNVPTFDSLGVKNFTDVFWYGVVAPPGLDPEIAERIQQILKKALTAEPGQSKLRAIDVEPVCSTPAEFGATMAKETRQWKELAENSASSPNSRDARWMAVRSAPIR